MKVIVLLSFASVLVGQILGNPFLRASRDQEDANAFAEETIVALQPHLAKIDPFNETNLFQDFWFIDESGNNQTSTIKLTNGVVQGFSSLKRSGEAELFNLGDLVEFTFGAEVPSFSGSFDLSLQTDEEKTGSLSFQRSPQQITMYLLYLVIHPYGVFVNGFDFSVGPVDVKIDGLDDVSEEVREKISTVFQDIILKEVEYQVYLGVDLEVSGNHKFPLPPLETPTSSTDVQTTPAA